MQRRPGKTIVEVLREYSVKLDDGKYYSVNMSRDDLGPEQKDSAAPSSPIGSILCDCNGVALEHQGREIALHYSRNPKWALIPGFPAGAVHLDLLEILLSHGLSPSIGQVYAKKTKELCESYRSVYVHPDEGVVLRGGSGATYRVCKKCGTKWLRMPGDIDGLELVKHYIQDRKVLMDGARLGFIVSSSVGKEIERAKFKYIKLDPLNIVASPADGFTLPGDPDWSAIDPKFVPASENNWESPW